MKTIFIFRFKKNKLVYFLTCIFAFPFFLHGESNEKTYFAVVAQINQKGQGNGIPFLGYYLKNFFPEDDVSSILSHFEKGKKYRAWGKNRAQINVTIKNIHLPEGDLGETLINTESGIPENFPLLLSSNEAEVKVLKSVPLALTTEQKEIFNNEIKALVNRARADLKNPTYRLNKILKTEAIKVENRNSVITVFFRLEMNSDQGKRDQRGSVLFIYDLEHKKIIFSRFGHPEWSPDVTNAEALKPIFFFELNKNAYIFCMEQGPWEYSGYSFLELSTGKKMLKSF